MGEFTAEFSGVCGFVHDVEFNDPDVTENPTKVMVLMVDGAPQTPPLSKHALEGEAVRDHAPLVVFKTGDLVSLGQLPKDAETHLFVNRKELSFEIDESPAGSNVFSVSQRLPPASDEDFRHVVHVKEIIKNSTSFKLKPECFQSAPPPPVGIISARVRLETFGLLSVCGLDPLVEFDFANTLNGGFARRALADQVCVKFVKVTQVRLVLKDLDTGDVEKMAFNTDGRNVKIVIGNLCGDLLVPVIKRG